MPGLLDLLDRAVSQIQKNTPGTSTSSAYAIATAAMQKAGNMKKGSQQLTKQGKQRQAMTPAQRRANPP